MKSFMQFIGAATATSLTLLGLGFLFLDKDVSGAIILATGIWLFYKDEKV